MPWTVATLNLNGIRSANRRGFAAWRDTTPVDVLLLQELRMQRPEMTAEHLPPDGWAHAQADAEKKGYSGAAVWSRLPAKAAQTGCGLGWADAEGRIARLDLAQATVISAYLPSGSSGPERQAKKDEFLEYFLPVTAGLLASGSPVLIGGDVNIAHREIDIHDPKGNAKNSGFLPHERAWMDRLLAQGWVDLYRHLCPAGRDYSWWSNRGRARENNKGWRIDYLLASPALAARAEACWIHREADLSDHAPVLARFRD